MDRTDRDAADALGDDTLSYDDLVADQDDAEALVAADDAELSAPRRSRAPLWIALGLLGGFALSVGASYLLRPEPFDASRLQAEVAALQNEVETLRTRAAPASGLRPLERRIESLENRETPDVQPVALEPFEARLDALGERVSDIEQAEPPVVDEDLVARLEALQADGFTASPPPDLSELLGRVAALEERSAAPEPEVVDLAPLEARINALESRPAPRATRPAVVPAYPPFPSDALRDAVEARQGGGLFSKHIRVRDDNDPATLLDGIEADLKAGRTRAALAKFDRLPEPIRNLARGWRADMDDVTP